MIRAIIVPTEAAHMIDVFNSVEQARVIVAVPVSKHSALDGIKDLDSRTRLGLSLVALRASFTTDLGQLGAALLQWHGLVLVEVSDVIDVGRQVSK